METPRECGRVLLTGATGFVGGRLLGRLLETGRTVRCLARRPDAVRLPPAAPAEALAGDTLDKPSLARAMRDVDVAYYLIHSMGSGGDFESLDRRSASNFAAAARRAGVRRIVYLGGLAEEGADLSPHLRSRHEVGRILAGSGVEVVEFRASVIIGSGSLSFELVRSLVERLPVMVCPRWVRTEAQPIAIGDVLDYLAAALDLPPGPSRIFEIGGPDRVSYQGIMKQYARRRGLRRCMIPVPVLTPYLSSVWLALVTPVLAGVGRSLIEGVRSPSVVRDPGARSAFDTHPACLAEAIDAALAGEEARFARRPLAELARRTEPDNAATLRWGNRILDCRATRVAVEPGRAFEPVARIGGPAGWYYGNWLWKLRGLIDLAVGGPGFAPSRRGPQPSRPPRAGDLIDFWRVVVSDPPRRLRLEARMKLPGRAWLEFQVEPDHGGSIIRQIAAFDPTGLAGLLYWHALWPVHKRMFAGMLAAIARAACRDDDARQGAEAEPDRPAGDTKGPAHGR